jgi:hypothetical protein
MRIISCPDERLLACQDPPGRVGLQVVRNGEVVGSILRSWGDNPDERLLCLYFSLFRKILRQHSKRGHDLFLPHTSF